ncbi:MULTISPECIES: hypothetical protein [Streptomyces]|uniref:Uncharacterized protein n=1 Tax=Streptomyces pseudovenezuelae TaxID=67350 RepID=A0A124H8E2_9ACTN|nr:MULTISPECIES: hypothetical protein [Streptomyces]KUM82413.1 hypothetical protein AQI94_41510 [Streptomyces pseudovenezuelae]
MTSFLTHRARVHDVRLPLHRRHSALRTCVTLFAPYGFRATYHHLTLSAGIPRRLEADPDALVRAVEELHQARVLWLARAEEYVVQRRAEKRAGRRAVPNPRPWWLRSWWAGWAGPERAWYEDPFRHPSLRLPEYVRRRNALLDGADLPGCPACGTEGPPTSVSTGHSWVELCQGCAWAAAPCPCGQRHRLLPETPYGWDEIWQRAHMSDDGLPHPHWPAGRSAGCGRRPVS